MRGMRGVVAALCLPAVLGCTRVHHAYTPLQAAGSAVSVEVFVNRGGDEPVTGTVYYRTFAGGPFETAPMQVRGETLWASLPTGFLQPEETVEYYIDVTKNGKLITLGTPGHPYVVTFKDAMGMVLATLSDRPYASDDEHPVHLVLFAGDHPIQQPQAIYQMPGVPGDIRAPMEADGRGNYRLVIDAHAVSPGTWRYAIEVPLEGQVVRLPRLGFRSFVVTPAYHEQAYVRP